MKLNLRAWGHAAYFSRIPMTSKPRFSILRSKRFTDFVFDIDVTAIRVWGDEYRRIGRFESDYHTLAGTVRVMRTVYRKTERNGDTLDPVSVRAGVVADGWLPHTARAMAYIIAQ